MLFLEQTVGELFDVGTDFVGIGDEIVFLVEVVAVVESCGGELEVHGAGEFIQRNQIVAVLVAQGLTKANVLDAHFVEGLQGLKAALKTVITAAEVVVGGFHAFDRNANADVGVLFGKLDYTVHPPAAGADHNAGGLLEHDFNDFVQVLTDERFTAGNVGELELGQNFQVFSLYFFALLGRVLPDVAHLAAHLATIRGNHRHVGRHLDLGIALFARFAGHKILYLASSL